MERGAGSVNRPTAAACTRRRSSGGGSLQIFEGCFPHCWGNTNDVDRASNYCSGDHLPGLDASPSCARPFDTATNIVVTQQCSVNMHDRLQAPNISRRWPLRRNGGERRTLLLVARYADACNLIASNVDEVANKLAVLRTHCESRVETTTLSRRRPSIGSFSQVLEKTDLSLAEARH